MPRATRSRTTYWPIKPFPPVTNTRFTSNSFVCVCWPWPMRDREQARGSGNKRLYEDGQSRLAPNIHIGIDKSGAAQQRGERRGGEVTENRRVRFIAIHQVGQNLGCLEQPVRRGDGDHAPLL